MTCAPREGAGDLWSGEGLESSQHGMRLAALSSTRRGSRPALALPAYDAPAPVQAGPGVWVHGGRGGVSALLGDLDRSQQLLAELADALADVVRSCHLLAADAQEWERVERSELLGCDVATPTLTAELERVLGALAVAGARADARAVECGDLLATLGTQARDLSRNLGTARRGYAKADADADVMIQALRGGRSWYKRMLNLAVPGANLGSWAGAAQSATVLGGAHLVDGAGALVGRDPGAQRALAPAYDLLVGDLAESLSLAGQYAPVWFGSPESVRRLTTQLLPAAHLAAGAGARSARVRAYQAPAPAAVGPVSNPIDALAQVELLYDRHGMQKGTVAVQRNRLADGETTWVVMVPGTQGGFVEPHGFDWLSNVRLAAGLGAPSVEAVEAAMVAAGVRPGERVAIVGHSQGGLVAVEAASRAAESGRFSVQNVLTAGSPTGSSRTVPGVEYLHVETVHELVSSADGGRNPDDPHRTTVTYDLTQAAAPEVRRLANDSADAHSVAAHVAALRAAKDHPSADAALRRIGTYFDARIPGAPPAATQAEVRYFQSEAVPASGRRR
ncbi:MAG: alpha/beta hydrolase [Cellulomonadaceae bacterium]